MHEIIKTAVASIASLSPVIFVTFFKNEQMTTNISDYAWLLIIVSSLVAFLLVNFITFLLRSGLQKCNKKDLMFLKKLQIFEEKGELENVIDGTKTILYALFVGNMFVSVIFYCFGFDFIEYMGQYIAAFCLLYAVSLIIYYWMTFIKYRLNIFRAIAFVLIVLFPIFQYVILQHMVTRNPMYQEMYYTNENQINIVLPVAESYTIISPLEEKIKTTDVVSRQMYITSVIDLTNDNCVAGTYKIKCGEEIRGSFTVIFAGNRKDKEEYFDKYVSMLRRDDFAAYEKFQDLIPKIKQCTLDGDKVSFEKIASEFDKNNKEEKSMIIFMIRIKMDPTFLIVR